MGIRAKTKEVILQVSVDEKFESVQKKFENDVDESIYLLPDQITSFEETYIFPQFSPSLILINYKESIEQNLILADLQFSGSKSFISNDEKATQDL